MSARDQAVPIVLAVCALMLVLGFGLKGQCLEPWDGRQWERLCYNDIQALYGVRGVEAHTFPYVDAELADGGLANGAIEYPVLTGVFMWASGLTTDGINQYLILSAFLLAPFALLTAYWLGHMVKLRALLWSAAPALVLYAFHNWDLLVVCAAVAGIYAWHRERYGWAAVAFAVGAAFKMYPGFFLAALFFDRWRAGRLREGLESLGTGVLTFVLINLPFVVANPGGWWATYDFHRMRGPNYDSIWYLGWPNWTPDRYNLVSGGLTVLCFIGALAYGYRRGQREERYPFVQVCAALLASFLLFNKVHSPQYTLWILPFFALLEISIGWWVAYALADLAAYVGVFRWFHDIQDRGLDFTAAKKLMIAGVWGRAALLAVLVVVFLQSRPAEGVGEPEPAEEPVSPPEPAAA